MTTTFTSRGGGRSFLLRRPKYRLRFPDLPVEYFDEEWLRTAGDEIGKTIKVDNTTRATTRGRFARVCVEIDMGKPLKATYRMRGKNWRLQYEGLQDLCFTCGKCGHKEVGCPLKEPEESKATEKTPETTDASTSSSKEVHQAEEQPSSFGPSMVAKKNRCRPMVAEKGNSGNSKEGTAGNVERDKAESSTKQTANRSAVILDSQKSRQPIGKRSGDSKGTVKSHATKGKAQSQENISNPISPNQPQSMEGPAKQNPIRQNPSGSRFEVLREGEEMDTQELTTDTQGVQEAATHMETQTYNVDSEEKSDANRTLNGASRGKTKSISAFHMRVLLATFALCQNKISQIEFGSWAHMENQRS